MKINELKSQQLDEGPLDFAKKAVAGAKGLAQGGVQGAKAGWATQDVANKTADTNTATSQAQVKAWATQAQNIKTSSGAEPTPQDAADWYKQTTGKAPSAKPVGTTPAQMQQWLEKEAAFSATRPAAPAQPQTPADQPTQSQQAKTPPQPKVAPAPTAPGKPVNNLTSNTTGQRWVRKQGQWFEVKTSVVNGARSTQEVPVTDFEQVKRLNKVAAQQGKGKMGATGSAKPGAKLGTEPQQQELDYGTDTDVGGQGGTYGAGGSKLGAFLRGAGANTAAGAADDSYKADLMPNKKGGEQEQGATDDTPAQAGTQAGTKAGSVPGKMPDISKLTAEERAELRRQLQASM